MEDVLPTPAGNPENRVRESATRARWRPEWTVLIAMLVYTLIFSTFSLMRHFSGAKGDPDLGLYDQAFYTATQGRLFHNDFEGMSHFGIHNSPIFFLLLPIYALGGYVSLEVLMAAVLALGAWPLFRLAQKRVSPTAGVWFALMYLLFHPLHGVNYDQGFHEMGFVLTPLIFAVYFMLDHRYLPMWASIIVALTCREDVGFTVAFLGLFGLLATAGSGRPAAGGPVAGGGPAAESFIRPADAANRRRLMLNSIAMLLVGALWVYLSLYVIIPHFRPNPYGYFAERYGYLGSTLPQVLGTILTRPLLWMPKLLEWPRISYLLEFIFPTAGLCLFAPGLLIPAIPTLAINLLPPNYDMCTTGSRCASMVIPFFWCAAVLGLQKVAARESDPVRRERKVRRWITTAFTLTLLFTLAFNCTPFNDPFHRMPRITDHSRLVMRMARQVPPQATVATQAGIYQFLSRREGCYAMRYQPGVEYILVDRSPRNERDKWFRHAGWDRVLPQLISSGAYEVLADEDGVILLRRKAPPSPVRMDN